MRINPSKDLRGRLPDHLSLPKYSDKFVVNQDANLARCLYSNQKGVGLNELKWTMGLRKESSFKTSSQAAGKDEYSDYANTMNEGSQGAKKFSSLRMALSKS